MDLEDVWGSTEQSSTNEDGEIEEYVDALGNQQSERMAAIPVPSMTERGNTMFNSHRLELHTGGQRRAHKTGQGIPIESDPDRDRPVQYLNKQATSKIQRVVSKNREHVQPAPENETQLASRRDLYDGYNVASSTLARVPKVQTVTNRSAQELFMYGPEVRGEEHNRLSAEARDPLKAGAFKGDEFSSQGRSSTAFSGGAMRGDVVHTFLGGEGLFERKEGDGPGKATLVSGERLPSSVRIARHQRPAVPIRNLTTSTDVQESAGRAGIALNNSRNDRTNNTGTRYDGQIQLQGPRVEGQIGADAIQSGDPSRMMSSFVRSAALAEHVMGESDSSRTRDAFTSLHPSFSNPALHPGIQDARRNDDRSRPDASLQQRGDMAAHVSARGRDRKHDSQAAARLGIIDNRGHNLPGAIGDLSRRGPAMVGRSLAAAFGRGRTHDQMHSIDPSLQLNKNEGTDVFATNRRDGGGGAFLSSLIGSISKLITRSDTTTFTQGRGDSAQQAVHVVSANPERHLRDDSLAQSHALTMGGPIMNSPAPFVETLNDRKQAHSSVARPNSLSVAPLQRPSLTYNGFQQ